MTLALKAVIVLVALLAATGAYAKITHLRMEAAEARATTAEAAFAEAKADKDRQVGALSRQLAAAQDIAAASATIMRAVHAAPPSASCVSSPRVGAYLGELRRRPAANLSNGSAGGTNPVSARTTPPGRNTR